MEKTELTKVVKVTGNGKERPFIVKMPEDHWKFFDWIKSQQGENGLNNFLLHCYLYGGREDDFGGILKQALTDLHWELKDGSAYTMQSRFCDLGKNDLNRF